MGCFLRVSGYFGSVFLLVVGFDFVCVTVFVVVCCDCGFVGLDGLGVVLIIVLL